MDKLLRIGFCLLLVINILLIIFNIKYIKNIPEYSIPDSIYMIRDSIKQEIDTNIILIERNNNYYEKVIDTIKHNSINDNYIFFKTYLKHNKERFDSCDN